MGTITIRTIIGKTMAGIGPDIIMTAEALISMGTSNLITESQQNKAAGGTKIMTAEDIIHSGASKQTTESQAPRQSKAAGNNRITTEARISNRTTE